MHNPFIRIMRKKSGPLRAITRLLHPKFSINVMTYNIHSCINIRGKSDPGAIAGIINDCSPDVVALQEVDAQKKRTGWVDQAGWIASRLKMRYEFYPVIQKGAEEYGLAILSRYPMEKVKFDLLAENSRQGSAEPRGAMWVKLATPAGTIHLINTHLGLTANERNDQVDALLGEAWGLSACIQDPLIVCGDFNAGIRSPVYRKMSECFSDVQERVHQRGYPRATFISMYPMLRIDHLFVSGALNPLTVHVPAGFKLRTASDHLPICAELAFNENKAKKEI